MCIFAGILCELLRHIIKRKCFWIHLWMQTVDCQCVWLYHSLSLHVTLLFVYSTLAFNSCFIINVQKRAPLTYNSRQQHAYCAREKQRAHDKYIVINRYIYKLHDSMFLASLLWSFSLRLSSTVLECVYVRFVIFVLAVQNLVHVIADWVGSAFGFQTWTHRRERE